MEVFRAVILPCKKVSPIQAMPKIATTACIPLKNAALYGFQSVGFSQKQYKGGSRQHQYFDNGGHIGYDGFSVDDVGRTQGIERTEYHDENCSHDKYQNR